MQNLKPAFNSLSFYHSFQTLQRELQGHKGKIEDVLERAGIIASIRSPEADNIRTGHDQLAQLWSLLWVESERRQLVLDAMYQAQQYFFDTAEVEAWLSEQELHMMNEEKGKVCVWKLENKRIPHNCLKIPSIWKSNEYLSHLAELCILRRMFI